MADKSITYPLSIFKNVPTKIGRFVIPTDFVVLEMEEDLEIPILFGRPFLMIAGAIIDIKRGKIILEVDNEHMKFDVHKIMKLTPVEVASRIDSIDIIDECVDEVIPECLRRDSMETHMVQEVSEQILEVIPYQSS